MKKQLFLRISDSIFLSFIGFLISLIIFRNFTPKNYSLIFAFLFSLLIFLFFFKFFGKKQLNKNKAIAFEKDLNEVLNGLCFTDSKEAFSLLSAFANSSERKKGGVYNAKTKTLHLALFSFEGVNKTAIVKAYNKINKNEKVIIYSPFYDDLISPFINLFPQITVIHSHKLYNLMQSLNLLEKAKRVKLESPENKRATFKGFFNKKRAKNYFFFGATFLLLSFIVPLKLYYTVCGVVFLIFSVCCKFFGKEPKPAY